MVDEILDRLFKIGDLKEIARELGVSAILEGSVRKIGNNVRITVQLIDTKTDTHLWSETAQPELGWQFGGWMGDTVSSANPISVQMDSNISLMANFLKLSEVPVTFKVDMKGVDVTNGVYVTGDFPNQSGQIWQLNKMIHTGNDIYQYKTNISIGTSGAYYFLNDDKWGVRESVPSECADFFGSDRGFNIPVNSTGETFAYVWSSCEELIIPGNISEFELDKQIITIHPNPVTNSEIYISPADFPDQLTISLFDIHGRIMYSEYLIVNAESQIIKLPELASGIYLVRIFSGKSNETENHKLLIIKL